MATTRPADMAIDLGTSNTRVAIHGKGIVVDTPTVLATQGVGRGCQVVAVGEEARRMIGRTPPGTDVIRPVRGGVVANFEATERLLRALLREAGGRTVLRPRVVVCIPSGTTEVERRAVQESARAAGAREVSLMTTALAGAVGAELPVWEPVGSLVVDIGGGRTDVAVTSLGGLVVRRSAQLGGDDLDAAILNWLRKEHSLLIGIRTAENLKLRIGGVGAGEAVKSMRIRGRDLATGSPRELDITTTDIAVALRPVVERIRRVLIEALADTPPELSADIVDRGLILCGGASQLRGLDDLLRQDTGLPVLRPESPEGCVIRGAMSLLGDRERFDRALMR